MGLGLNINQIRFASSAPNPISMRQITGIFYNTDRILEVFLEKLENRYSMLKNGQLNLIDEQYTSHLYQMQVKSLFQDKDGVFQGTIIGVAPQGALQIKKENGEINEYWYKEVIFLHE